MVLAKLIAPVMHSWASQALCIQTDPDMFFSDSASATAQAKAVCGRCRVRAQCLDYALNTDERHGVWGGLDAHERRNLARRRKAAAPRSPGVT